MLLAVWTSSSSGRPTRKGRPSHLFMGDLPAFNRQVRTQQTRLYTIAYRVLGSQALAESATQSAVEDAYRQGAALDPAQAETALLRSLVASLRRARLSDQPAADGLLSALPFELRLPIVLIDVAGLNYDQAADALHTSLVELVQQLARARRMLCQSQREMLDGVRLPQP